MFYHLQAADSRDVRSIVNREDTNYCTFNSTTISKKLRRKGIKILILLQRKLQTCGRHTEYTVYQLSELHFNRSVRTASGFRVHKVYERSCSL